MDTASLEGSFDTKSMLKLEIQSVRITGMLLKIHQHWGKHFNKKKNDACTSWLSSPKPSKGHTKLAKVKVKVHHY